MGKSRKTDIRGYGASRAQASAVAALVVTAVAMSASYDSGRGVRAWAPSMAKGWIKCCKVSRLARGKVKDVVPSVVIWPLPHLQAAGANAFDTSKLGKLGGRRTGPGPRKGPRRTKEEEEKPKSQGTPEKPKVRQL